MLSMNGLRLASSRCARRATTYPRSLRPVIPTRNLHKRRELPYPIAEGLGSFLPPQALQVVGIDYQNGLLERLNEEIRGTPNENKKVSEVVIQTAPHESETLAFNYASLALNNSYFLDTLAPPPKPPSRNHEDKIVDSLLSQIRIDHGSLEQLKSSFSAGALGISTCGWVWFVTDSHGNTGILPTIGPSTLLVQSRKYLRKSDFILGEETISYSGSTSALGVFGFPASPVSGLAGGHTSTPSHFGTTGVRHIHSSPPSDNVARSDVYQRTRQTPLSKTEIINMGDHVFPLFCISVYEHAWMSAGYGVWGKEAWLKEFWSVLDWAKISQRYLAAHTKKNNNISD
ncbi:hypothetical protein HGRIS_009860 [Hohenbuehelia grisea]|uniref:Manganese/iron superoxide dismutase C-terminal domain-containing protein n=1 Tax=Hohenbuehelia grisea TaxID=104357 RepID=A0ABR3J2I0_9AGAR